MRILDWLGAGILTLVLGGCDNKEDYSHHFKHNDSLSYMGTFVLRETYSSVLNTKADDDRTLRRYILVDQDVDLPFKLERKGLLRYNELRTLKEQGYRIIFISK